MTPPLRGHPRGGRAAAFLGFLGLLLSCAAVAAQDKKDGLPDPAGGREVTPEMKKICPELEHATGRLKDQLLALFFDLDPRRAQEPATKKVARELFDLTKEGPDTELLDKHLEKRGIPRIQSGVRTVIAAWEGRGLVWAFGRIAKQKEKKPNDGLARLIDGLQATDLREVWTWLERALDDTTPAPNWRAAQEAPPGYEDLRICDLALRSLGQRLIGAPGVTFPPALHDGQVSPMMPIADRDARLAAAKKFVAEDKAYRALRDKKPSAQATLDDAGKKELAETLKRLGVE